MSEENVSNIQRIAGKISNLPTRGFQWVSGGAITAIVFLVTIDVITRASLNKPVAGSYELSQLLMVFVASFAFAYTQVFRRHIAIPVLSVRLPMRVQAILECFAWLGGSVLYALVAWKSATEGLYRTSVGETTLTLGIPVGPFYFLFVFGCILFSVVLVANFIESLPKVRQ